jgi:hypothetical protein
MRRLWATREIEAPVDAAWDVITDLDLWPDWGPSVRAAELDHGADTLALGVTGHVTTALGVRLPFRVTSWHDGSTTPAGSSGDTSDRDGTRSWSWRVAGVGATDHTVEALGADRCRVGFGVPLAAAPYLAVCRVALTRIDRLAVRRRGDGDQGNGCQEDR